MGFFARGKEVVKAGPRPWFPRVNVRASSRASAVVAAMVLVLSTPASQALAGRVVLVSVLRFRPLLLRSLQALTLTRLLMMLCEVIFLLLLTRDEGANAGINRELQQLEQAMKGALKSLVGNHRGEQHVRLIEMRSWKLLSVCW